MSIEEKIKQLSLKTNKTEAEIKKMISDQMDELCGLIDEEGACHLIEKELLGMWLGVN